MFTWRLLCLFPFQLVVSNVGESCESSDSSLVALALRRRQCLAANFKFPDFQQLREDEHFREVWGSSEELERWYREHFACMRPSLLQESTQLDAPSFVNVAKAMKSVDWGAIQWGEEVPIPLTKKKHNFGYGKMVMNGLYTMVAFAESDGSDWKGYLQGIGSLVGDVAVELMPGVGPILSIAITFALSFFQSQDDTMADLYNKIMGEVKLLIRAQEVKDAMSAAKGQLAGFMQMLAAMPMDFVVDPSSPLSKEQQWYNVLQRYITVMDASEFNIFGNEANCTMPMEVPMRPWLVEEASDDCLEFWASGAFIYQFQYVMIHLNTMAQMAAFGSKDQTAAVLSALRGKASTYHSLLNASLMGLVKGLPPSTQCRWILKEGNLHWGKSSVVTSASGGHLSDPMWNGHSLPCVLGCIDAVQDDFDLPWAPFLRMSDCKLDGDDWSIPCSKTPNSIAGSDVKPGTLDEQAKFRVCSSNGFATLVDLVFNETLSTFEPMLQALLNLSLDQYDSSEIMAWLSGSPPGPNNSEAVNSTVTSEFCEQVCTYLDHNACNTPMNCKRFEDVQKVVKCKEACEGAMEAFTNASKTRCSCKKTVCPAFNRSVYVNLVMDLPDQSWYFDKIDEDRQVGPIVMRAWIASLLKTTGHQGQCEIECNRLFPVTTLDWPYNWYY